jgi:hypothetical protein
VQASRMLRRPLSCLPLSPSIPGAGHRGSIACLAFVFSVGREFAEATGLPFRTTEDEFGEGDSKKVARIVEGGPNLNPELSQMFLDLAAESEAQGAARAPFSLRLGA